MKSIEFGEDQLSDLQSVAQQLFHSDTPGEAGYRRILYRPAIRWPRIALQIAVPLLIALMLFFALGSAGLSAVVFVSVPLLFLALYSLLWAKAMLICMIRIYQRYAPSALRNKCRFEPSCSEYMVLSIEKFGLIRGVGKGIARLRRCDIHHGGFDYP